MTDQASFLNPFPSWRREASTMRDRRTKPLLNGWCERRDLNPHGGYPPDPKSGASAVPPLSHPKSVDMRLRTSPHVSVACNTTGREFILPADLFYQIRGTGSTALHRSFARKPPHEAAESAVRDRKPVSGGASLRATTAACLWLCGCLAGLQSPPARRGR